MVVWKYDLIIDKQGVPSFLEKQMEMKECNVCMEPHVIDLDFSHVRLHSMPEDSSARKKLWEFVLAEGNRQELFMYTLKIALLDNTYEYTQTKVLAIERDNGFVLDFYDSKPPIPESVAVDKQSRHGHFLVQLLSKERSDNAEQVLQQKVLELLEEERSFWDNYFSDVRSQLHKLKPAEKKSMGDVLGLAKDVLSHAPTIYKENEDVIKSALEFALMFMGKKV